jgi:hypothetical protein
MDVLGGEGMMRMTVLMNHDALTRGGASDLCKVHSTQVTSNAQDSYPSIIRVDLVCFFQASVRDHLSYYCFIFGVIPLISLEELLDSFGIW